MEVKILLFLLSSSQQILNQEAIEKLPKVAK